MGAAIPGQLYDRQVSLLLVNGNKALDLSDMHITFKASQEDEESPNNASIRIHNLSDATIQGIMQEYTAVVLQAGYKQAYFGVIFQGTIKQWRIGREGNKVDTFLDILAADGDVAYNFSVVNRTLAAAQTSPRARLNSVIDAMKAYGVDYGQIVIQGTGGTLPRGKVLFGLARAHLRALTQNFGATWNISNGEIDVTDLQLYQPGEIVVLNSHTGLIGRPEQTQEGIKCRCLINPRIGVGNLVRIDQASINQTIQQKDHAVDGAQLPYNQWAGVQMLANTAADGLYRVYVIDYDGDTRGEAWYQDMILLAVDPTTGTCKAYG